MKGRWRGAAGEVGGVVDSLWYAETKKRGNPVVVLLRDGGGNSAKDIVYEFDALSRARPRSI